MIIDFHTHTFPDKIADKTIAYLSEKGKVKAQTKGTLSALKDSMQKAGVNLSVILPVATAPKQVESINRTACELNGKNGILYAGAIHPDCKNIDEILDTVKAYGLFGVKIHPDYQEVYFDDERYLNIMEKAAARGLITVTHAGKDVGYPDTIRCTPDRVLNVLDRLRGAIDNKLVLAHMGGCDMPDEVLEKLIGKPVYMDTSFVLNRYYDKCREIMMRHGTDKILFATDSPWANQAEFVRLIHSFGFSDAEEAKIFCQNAEKLLHISPENHRYRN